MRLRRSRRARADEPVLAREAGYEGVSGFGTLAGVFAAYGAVAVLVALAAGIAEAVGVDTDFTNSEWRQIGTGGAIVLGVVLFAAWLFGGYVAGRMAGRAGAMNGLATFVLGVIVVVAVAAVVEASGGTEDILDRLRDLGIPTTADQWSDIGTFAGIGSLLAMLLGSIFGGVLGVRWHAKVLRLAADPTVGPAAVRTERYVPEDTVDHDHDHDDDRDHDHDRDRDHRPVDLRDDHRTEPVRVDHNRTTAADTDGDGRADTDGTRVVTYADGSIAEERSGRHDRH